MTEPNQTTSPSKIRDLSIGKLRGLQQCLSARGTFTCLALDHRQNLRKANPLFVDNTALSQFKLDVTAELAPYATAVLLDPEVSAAQAIAAGRLPGTSPFVVAVESTGYSGDSTARRAQIIPGWSVEKAKRMGASMIKPGSGSLKMVQAGGTHGAQISTLSGEQRKLVIETMEKWLEMKIQ